MNCVILLWNFKWKECTKKAQTFFIYTIHIKSTACFLFVPICVGCDYIPVFFCLGFFGPVRIVPTHFSVGPTTLHAVPIYFIFCRFCLSETSCPQEDHFPSNLCVKVNGKPCNLPVSLSLSNTIKDLILLWQKHFTSKCSSKMLFTEVQKSFLSFNQWKAYLIIYILEKHFSLVWFRVLLFFYNCL